MLYIYIHIVIINIILIYYIHYYIILILLFSFMYKRDDYNFINFVNLRYQISICNDASTKILVADQFSTASSMILLLLYFSLF